MEHTLQYWLHFVDKLRVDRDISEMLPDILKDLCHSFDFGCGFVYTANYNNVFHLQASYERYKNDHLQQSILLQEELGEEQFHALKQISSLSFYDQAPPRSALELALGQLFQAKSLVFIPIFGKDRNMISMVGIVDRRSQVTTEQTKISQLDRRHSTAEMNTRFACSALTIVANYIELQFYQKQVENSQASLEGILDNMGIDVYVNDFDTHEILYLNRSMAAPYGDVSGLLGKPCWQVLYDDKNEECAICPRPKLLDEDGKPSKVFNWEYQRPFDGSWFRVFSAAFPWYDGRMAHVISSVDITENKRNKEIIRTMAERDYLTMLPNRYALSQNIDARLLKSDDPSTHFHLIFFDLDGFKKVNDTFGHKVGDELLSTIGGILQASPYTQGHSYRYGGDEFVIFVDKSTPGNVEQVCTFLQETFQQTFPLSVGSASVGASIGISVFPQDATQTGALIRKADQAMYASKREGKGRIYLYNRGVPTPMSL